jgi:hypothetical protein
VSVKDESLANLANRSRSPRIVHPFEELTAPRN